MPVYVLLGGKRRSVLRSYASQLQFGWGEYRGNALTPDEFAKWDVEHKALLENYPEEFDVKHYAAIAVLKRK